MIKVAFRQKAIDDLDRIWYYTYFKWSENQANIYYNAIKASCIEIGKNPEIGNKYFKLVNDILGLKSGKHIIFYQQTSKDKIEILRILHERMDLKSRLIE
ncbi:MAG: type II toxin-antitoxin system RelE/ParE family toxin [Chitinophagales bacterium]|nr:type II toxin-antitoxin system RelE/ParE family toxin [Chitinophagales bacterium]